jgi:isoquinoline 1-oxidoreductase beta subunit
MPRIRSQTYGEWGNLTYAWRSVSNFTDAFVRECFLDEMADALGRDPYELRMELLPGSAESPLKKVLEVAVSNARWNEPLPDGWGRGIAVWSTWDITPVAQVVEVEVRNGAVRVHRVVCAIECGIAINPDLIEAQMEGGIAWGLTALLKQPITIKNGRVQQSNLHDNPILTIEEMPIVEVHIVPSSRRPAGVGEMGVPPIAPAVLNGIYAATGKRIRHLPIRPEDLQG